MSARPATTHIRCPRCRSRDFQFHEAIESTQTWEVSGGKLDRALGYMEPGCVVGIRGECFKCGHNWRLRALQITDVVHEPQEPRP